jgi:hypothetical protein
MVMKAAEDGHRYDAAPVLDDPMDRGIFVERPMCPQLVIVSGIFRQNSAQMRLTQDDEMVACTENLNPNVVVMKAAKDRV